MYWTHVLYLCFSALKCQLVWLVFNPSHYPIKRKKERERARENTQDGVKSVSASMHMAKNVENVTIVYASILLIFPINITMYNQNHYKGHKWDTSTHVNKLIVFYYQLWEWKKTSQTIITVFVWLIVECAQPVSPGTSFLSSCLLVWASTAFTTCPEQHAAKKHTCSL